MISVEDKFFYDYINALSFLSIHSQRATITCKYYYIQLLIEGMNRIRSTS